MEMNAGSPTLEVRRENRLLCQFRLDADRHPSENNVLMIGDLRCTPDTSPTRHSLNRRRVEP